MVAANRDEFHARPAERAGFWKDQPGILAGRDLEAKGTWMGVSRSGRFAAVTNYRGGRDANAAESRGMLVTRFLLNSQHPEAFISELSEKQNSYSGFNLLLADREELWWLSNRDGGSRRLEPGIYGLGNFFLDTPEVDEPKNRFLHAIDPAPSMEPLFTVLAASKIVAPEYGTRCSAVLLDGIDGVVHFAERAFDAEGEDGETVRFEMQTG
ncbi:MAG: NRDE family protein [Pseudomonadota bacterium]